MIKKLKKILFRYFLSPSRSIISRNEYMTLIKLIDKPNKILNVGSSTESVLGYKFWKYLEGEYKLINLDICPGENIDIVCDAAEMPFSDGSFDLVVCQAVLEHVENPKKVVSEIKRVLKGKGLFYCTVPFLQGFHADPYDYQRFTMVGMRKLLSEYEIIKEGISSGPFSAIAWIIRDILTFGRKGSLTYNISRIISSLLSFPISLLDFIYPKIDSFKRNASEYYYLARSK